MQISQITSVLVGVALLATTPAFAQDGRFSGNVALTSDYVFRGISQSDENPAIQGGFDYTNGAFYAGAWASSIDFGADASGSGSAADLEVDVYGGWRSVLGPVTLDLGVIGYLYPGSTDDFGEYDYWEGYASMAPTERTSVGVAAYYSPEFTTETGDARYVEANGSANLSEAIAISGAVGHQTADAAIFGGEDSYTSWNVGGTMSAHGFGFDLRYHATDIDDLPIADDRVVFSVRRSL